MSIFAELLVNLENLAFGTSSIGIVQETFDLLLYAFGEKVALDCGYALWGLGRDDVDSYYPSAWLGPFNCDLYPSISVSSISSAEAMGTYLAPAPWCISLNTINSTPLQP